VEHGSGIDAALTVSIALAAGMVSQSAARHLRVPGIVLLLLAGVLLGPDGLGLVLPDSLGPALQILVGFAVAVILFEGGMNLGLKRLRRQAGVIQRLITVGALITAAGGMLLAHFVMEWDWRLAGLFGSLVVVTGPTVITPLLRRYRITHKVETVLEAEGVLIDAVGAVLAVVTFEVVLSFSAESLAEGVAVLFGRLGFGLVFGCLAGLAIAFLLRFKKVVPDGFENVLTLSLVLVLFQVSNAIMPESGIMTVTAAGVVVGNIRTRALDELMEFKEQLTLMFIGLLFVLLTAAVRVQDVLDLGWPGMLTVAGLMFLVRPLNVWVCTLGSDLNVREKAFIAWLAPRGVVAAAVASLFATRLDAAGMEGGTQLLGLVFLVIAVTVNVQGSTGGFVAARLGLRRPSNRGFAILGANELGRAIGRLLTEAGTEVVFIDNNPSAVRAAEQDGFKVVYGNIYEERTLARAELDERQGCIAVTPNEEVNLLFAETARGEFGLDATYIALRQTQTAVEASTVTARGAGVLFGRPRDLDLWMVRLRRGLAKIERWRLTIKPEGEAGGLDFTEQLVLPLVLHSGTKTHPVRDGPKPRKGDEIDFALFAEQSDRARAELAGRGWQPTTSGTRDSPA
jgi:NhaP-type Na+/H+ or K+/H+ antiporter